MNTSRSIVRQAGVRLFISLGLLIALIASSSVGIYRAALHKTAQKRAQDLTTFYQARLTQIESQWETQSRDFRVRIEATRLLEQRPLNVAGIQAFLTMQGTTRNFQYLLIGTRDGRKLFDFGTDLSFTTLPDSAQVPFDHYQLPGARRFYRVFTEQIWLGTEEGQGRLLAFFPMDNALLEHIEIPGLTLTLFHEQGPIASSQGQSAIARIQQGEPLPMAAINEIPWPGSMQPAIRLRIEAPVNALFSNTEMTLMMSTIPLIDALILWFTLGLWLLRQTRRISVLGEAVDEYTRSQGATAALAARLAEARREQQDEIAGVAVAMEAMVTAIDEREQARESAMRQVSASEARLREVTSSLADGVLVLDKEGLITFVNPKAEELLGWSEHELLGRDCHETLHHSKPGGTIHPREECLIHRSIQEGTTNHCDPDWFERRDGGFLPVAQTSLPVYREGAIAGAVVTFRDISERKLAEAKLRKQQLGLNEAQRIAHIGSWEMDFTSGDLSWSDEIYRIFEIDPMQFKASYPTFIERIHPEDRVRVDRVFNVAIEEHTPYEVSHRLLLPDGRLKHVHERGEITYDAAGAPISAAGTVQDISKRVLDEMALKQSEERLALATRSGIIGVWDWDVVHNELIWDDAMYRLYGISAADFNGAYEAWAQALHPEDKAYAEAEIQAALAGEREYAPEFRVLWPDGSVHSLKAASQTIHDPAGHPLRMIGINYDLTELREATQESAELLDFNSKVISGSPLGILVYRADGPCVLANQAAADLVGATMEQLMAQNFRVTPSWQKSGLLAAALRTLESGDRQHMETHLLTTFGRELWLSCDFVPLTRGGAPHLLLIINDVSAFRRTEAELRAAKEAAEEASRAKSEFLANMSHEIRTPLNAIIGMAELLKETEVTNEQREYITIFETNGEALLSIINDIIDLAKVEAGRIELEHTEFDPVQLVEETCALMALKAHGKGLEINSDLGWDLPARLEGDPARLRQILINLIGNAVKFTHAGEVVVRCTAQEEAAGLTKDEVELLFAVADTGIGIPEAKQQAIFERFVQADSTTTRRFGGTGLGLTISQQLVALMGGRLWLTSTEGAGSTFFFTTRFRLREHDAPELTANGLRPLCGLRVLIIDDNATNRLILHRMLTRWRIEVAESADGPSGLLQLTEAAQAGQPFDFILLDCRMPGMDGFEVARAIRENPALAGCPVMMLTSDDRRLAPQRYQEVGIRHCLVKPVRRDELLHVMSALHNQIEVIPFMAARNRQPPPAIQPLFKPARILLAEDYLHNRLIVERYLRGTALTLEVAENGALALALFQEKTYDLVLMDIQMPVMDGYTATREIRRFETLSGRAAVPIIALTAYALTEDEEKCLAAGCNARLTKPIKRERLFTVLAQYLNARQEHSGPAVPSPPAADQGEERTALSRSQAPGPAETIAVVVDQELLAFIPGFLADVANDCRRLQEAVSNEDWETVRSRSHNIKGAGGGYGLPVVSELAREVELAAKARDKEGAARGLAALAEYVDRVEIQ
jgi:PAS domain S-box-containing protein